jgi:hypothetical protein
MSIYIHSEFFLDTSEVSSALCCLPALFGFDFFEQQEEEQQQLLLFSQAFYGVDEARNNLWRGIKIIYVFLMFVCRCAFPLFDVVRCGVYSSLPFSISSSSYTLLSVATTALLHAP